MPPFRGHRRTVSDSSIQVSFFDSASNQGASAGSPSNIGSQEMVSTLSTQKNHFFTCLMIYELLKNQLKHLSSLSNEQHFVGVTRVQVVDS